MADGQTQGVDQGWTTVIKPASGKWSDLPDPNSATALDLTYQQARKDFQAKHPPAKVPNPVKPIEPIQAPVGGTFGTQAWKDKIPGEATNAAVSIGANALLPGSSSLSSILNGALSGALGGASGEAVDQLKKNRGEFDPTKILTPGLKQGAGQGLLGAIIGRAAPQNNIPETVIARGGTIPGVLGPQSTATPKSTQGGNPLLDLASHAGGKVGLLSQIARMLNLGGGAAAAPGEVPPLPEIIGGRTGTQITPTSTPIGSLPLNPPAPPAPPPRLPLPGTNNPAAAINGKPATGLTPPISGALPGQFPARPQSLSTLSPEALHQVHDTWLSQQPPVIPPTGGALPGQFPPAPVQQIPGTNGPLGPMAPTPPGPLSTSIPPGTTLQDMSPLSLAQRAQMAKLLQGSRTGVPGPRSFEPEPASPQAAKNAASNVAAKAKSAKGPTVHQNLPKTDKPMSDLSGLERALQSLQAAGNPPPGPVPAAALPPNLQPQQQSAPTGTLQWLLDSLNQQVARGQK